jgi:hypothetical protein
MAIPRTPRRSNIIYKIAFLTIFFIVAHQFYILFSLTEEDITKIKGIDEPQLRGASINAGEPDKQGGTTEEDRSAIKEPTVAEQPQVQLQPANEVVTAAGRISSEGAVVCDSTPCQGIFAYSGPNKDTSSAVDTMTKAIASYNYGPEANSETENKMIFMPTKTDPLSCVEEWKSSRSSWVDR